MSCLILGEVYRNDHSLYHSPDHCIVDALLPFVDIILFDPRGCGQSEKSLAKYCTLAHYIDDIESIRQHFSIPTKQFIVFGQSYGSIAAIGYAIKHPDRLKKLALIGGAASSDFIDEAKQNLARIGTPIQKQMAEKLWAGAFTKNAEEMAEFYRTMAPLYSYSFNPNKASTSISITYNVDVLNLGWGKFLRIFDYRSTLAQISCQTLILQGEDDWLFDKRQAGIIHHAIPNSELHLFSQCSHLLWIDQRDKFVQAMADFLNRPIYLF